MSCFKVKKKLNIIAPTCMMMQDYSYNFVHIVMGQSTRIVMSLYTFLSASATCAVSTNLMVNSLYINQEQNLLSCYQTKTNVKVTSSS